MHPGPHSDKGPAVRKTLLRPLQSLAHSGTNGPPVGRPELLTLGRFPSRGAPKPASLHIVWSHNQSSCGLGVYFHCQPSCDWSFCLTRYRERTPDWQSADLASFLSRAPRVTLDEPLKHSGPSLQLHKIQGPGEITLSAQVVPAE